MQGGWGVSHNRVHVESSDDLTWKSSGTAATVDPPRGWGDQDKQDVFPGQGGTEAVSGNRVPGGFSNTDGDAGALRAPASPSLLLAPPGPPPLDIATAPP